MATSASHHVEPESSRAKKDLGKTQMGVSGKKRSQAPLPGSLSDPEPHSGLQTAVLGGQSAEPIMQAYKFLVRFNPK